MNGVVRGRVDYILLFLTILLVGFGLVIIFSASSVRAIVEHHNPWYYVLKQSVFAFIGLVLMFLIIVLPYSFWRKAGPFLMLFSILLLALLLIAGGKINGAKRWIALGSFSFQPAEFAKLSIIVYLSALISKKGEDIRVFKKGLLPILIVLGITVSLIMMQPDFGTVIIVSCIAGTIILIGGITWRHLIMLALGLIPAFIYLLLSKSYRLQRLYSFMNPLDYQLDSGYQLIQSLYALGHGGLFGSGLGRSTQKLFYLPEAHTDFIFSILGEELGFIGAAVLILIYILFIWRGCLAAVRCSDPHGAMMAMGIVAMISVQALLNIGGVTGSLPITGVPLPFISYGGSSLILCMVSTGILLSISRHRGNVQPQK